MSAGMPALLLLVALAAPVAAERRIIFESAESRR
jgi:hypothetical protein